MKQKVDRVNSHFILQTIEQEHPYKLHKKMTKNYWEKRKNLQPSDRF